MESGQVCARMAALPTQRRRPGGNRRGSAVGHQCCGGAVLLLRMTSFENGARCRIGPIEGARPLVYGDGGGCVRPHVEQRVYVRGKVGHGTPLVGSRVGPLFWLPRIPKWWSACCSDVDGSVCGTQKTLRIGDCINSGKTWNQFLFLKPD